ncbi:MAG TPA: hypothetical protein DGT21_13360, partial [Armatimonadetes bacterium]|nr:hypothetical protein [Armatimonadota bacterium]
SARYYLGSITRAEFIAALQANSDAWDTLAAVAHRSGLAPLLLHALVTANGRTLLPGHIEDSLRTFALRTAARSMACLSALALALDLLQSEDIPVLGIKGIAFCALAPEYAALRLLSDIDLWLPTTQITTASAVLQEAGYVPDTTQRLLGPRDKHYLPLVCPATGVPIELHRRPWRPPVQVEPPEREMDVPPPPGHVSRPTPLPPLEYLVVIQALHAAICDAAPGCLRTALDIAILAGLRSIEWGCVLDIAGQVGARHGLRTVLSHAAQAGILSPPRSARLPVAREACLRAQPSDISLRLSAFGRLARRLGTYDGLLRWMRSEWHNRTWPEPDAFR